VAIDCRWAGGIYHSDDGLNRRRGLCRPSPATWVYLQTSKGAQRRPTGTGLLSAQDWDGGHVDREWKGPDSIRLWPVGSSFSVIRNWDLHQRCFSGWYGNLEQPWTRRGQGFDTRDLILDVRIEDDLSGWTLKDEDELAAATDVGLISARETDEVQRVAREVGRKIEERQWPFSEASDIWRTLAPVGDWRIAELPTGWDLISPQVSP
jgi:hypothetical protein